jgi:hypothetical protein
MLGNGKEIKVDGESMRMPWSARILSAQEIAYGVIYLFILGYAVLFIWALCEVRELF